MDLDHDDLWADLAAALESASRKHGKNLEPAELGAAAYIAEWLRSRKAG